MTKAATPLDPVKMTAMLRDGVLAIGPEDIGLSPEDCPQVWGVLMELAETEVVVSLVALADGSVSIYLSNGAGVIGCGLHPDVRVAASKLLNIAARATEFCRPTTQYPMPDAGHVRVYLLTSQGILVGDATRDALDEGEVGLAELYYAGHGVIGVVELLGAGVDLVDEMRLAEGTVRNDNQVGAEGLQEFKARGRGCRILPYVGNVARRSQN